MPVTGPGGHGVDVRQVQYFLALVGTGSIHQAAERLFVAQFSVSQALRRLERELLARMLGIHISVAVAWQRASNGDWTTYAANLSRRTATPITNPGAANSTSQDTR